MKYKYILVGIIILLLIYPFPIKKGESLKKMEKKFTIEKLSPEIKKRVVKYSCEEEACLKKLEDLRYISLWYIDFKGQERRGEMVVNSSIAHDIVEIFEELYQKKYPLERVELIDVYKGSDDASMKDNNTSAFNFRYIAGTKRLSKHAEGLAVDINPLYNPQVMENGKVYPDEGRAYAERSTQKPHMIDKKDLAYQLFIEHGFEWGGDWDRNKDYQHFEKEIK